MLRKLKPDRTFRPLAGGCFRCNQTKMLLQRSAVEGHRKAAAKRVKVVVVEEPPIPKVGADQEGDVQCQKCQHWVRIPVAEYDSVKKCRFCEWKFIPLPKPLMQKEAPHDGSLGIVTLWG
jgi:hypothetical protein